MAARGLCKKSAVDLARTQGFDIHDGNKVHHEDSDGVDFDEMQRNYRGPAVSTHPHTTKERKAGNILPTGAAINRTLIQELKTVAFS